MWVVWTWFTLGMGCIVKLPEAPRSAWVAYPTEMLELADGLRVVLERAPAFGDAGAVLLVGADSANEPAGRGGLAHLVEHLAYHGGGAPLRG